MKITSFDEICKLCGGALSLRPKTPISGVGLIGPFGVSL
jgi:hypothetical protein